MHGRQNIKTHTHMYVCVCVGVHIYIYIYIYTSFVHEKLTVHCLLSRLCNEAYFPSNYILLHTVIYCYICVRIKQSQISNENPPTYILIKTVYLLRLEQQSCVDGFSLAILFTQNTTGRPKSIKDIYIHKNGPQIDIMENVIIVFHP